MTILGTSSINEDEEVPARAVKVSHQRGSFVTPSYAVSVKDFCQGLVSREKLGGIVEVFIQLKPEWLREMQKDQKLLEKFESRVNRYMKSIPDDQLVVTIPLIEGGQGFSFNENEALFAGAYIPELVTHSRVDIVCTPIFNRVAEKNVDVLTKKFLETMSSYSVGVSLSIPYFSRVILVRLISIYMQMLSENNRALPNFLCVDYNDSNPISKYAFHNFVLGYLKSLQEEMSMSIVVYGANVKYSRVTKKYDEVAARDLASYFVQLDVFGGNHKRLLLPGEISERLKAYESLWKQKLLNRERYTYVSLDMTEREPRLMVPEAQQIRELIENGSTRREVEERIKSVVIGSILTETKVLNLLFSGNGWRGFESPSEYLMSKEVMKMDEGILKKLKYFCNALGLKNRRLDEYT